jgi:hypothetical protein
MSGRAGGNGRVGELADDGSDVAAVAAVAAVVGESGEEAAHGAGIGEGGADEPGDSAGGGQGEAGEDAGEHDGAGGEADLSFEGPALASVVDGTAGGDPVGDAVEDLDVGEARVGEASGGLGSAVAGVADEDNVGVVLLVQLAREMRAVVVM